MRARLIDGKNAGVFSLRPGVVNLDIWFGRDQCKVIGNHDLLFDLSSLKVYMIG